MKKLYLMIGIPGSGKSTWARKRKDGIIVSRDAIRFSFLKDEEDYFSKEDLVVKEFYRQINLALSASEDAIVYVDASNLNPKARSKVIAAIEDKSNLEIIGVVLDTPLKTCIERNSHRKGRALVPEDVIKRMKSWYISPTVDLEKYMFIREYKEVQHGKNLFDFRPTFESQF